MIEQLVSDNPQVVIGRGTYASSQPLLRAHHAQNKIIIGNYCSLAHDVTIFAGGNHPYHYITTHPLKLHFGLADFEEWSKDCGDETDKTIIGHDVWLGHGATILSGVTIGNGAIVGARAVVASDVPAYAIVVGNPAKVIRYRFDEKTILKLQEIAWWNWDEEKIKNHANLLCSSDINRFFFLKKEEA